MLTSTLYFCTGNKDFTSQIRNFIKMLQNNLRIIVQKLLPNKIIKMQ